MAGTAKGQIWSYDLLVAVSVFVFTLAIVMLLSQSISGGTKARLIDDLSNSAWELSGVLMSPGNPSNWSSGVNASNQSTWGNISLAGLLESFDSPQISQGKAGTLMQMNATNYSGLKAKLRTGYDFYVEVKEFYNCSDAGIRTSPYYNCTGRGIANDSDEWWELEHYARVGAANFTLGRAPGYGYANSISVANRLAVYNNSVVRVRVILWTNQTR